MAVVIEFISENAGIQQLQQYILTNIHPLLGLLVEVGTGDRTKYNRSILNLPKTHWLDAAYVGKSTPEMPKINGM